MATGAAAAIAAMTARARREVSEHFEAQDAFSPDRAVAYEAPSRMHERQFDFLIGRGIARPTGDGRYWLDREAMRREEARRKAAAKVVIAIIIAVALVAGVSLAIRR